ncbi:hypothetical protein LCGC14_0414300 [marine sediment metagenome]|uniref:Uncharacterized protein n=1 Tax=marine sediment metagenome TaxID=412755 RepID=A0A0F9SSQ3_9ZZZZ
MRVRVIDKPPIEKKHGVKLGNEYEVLGETERHTYSDGSPKRHSHNRSVWIMGAAGEKVKLLRHEWEDADDSA